jgi:hypothetical protein
LRNPDGRLDLGTPPAAWPDSIVTPLARFPP